MNATQPDLSGVPVYHGLATAIRDLGTECVFGLISDDTAALVATLDTLGVRFVGARHETSAVVMADGYADVSGRIGIAILGRGPAFANALNGAIHASRTGSQVLLVFGEAATASPTNALGPDYKALKASAILEAVGISAFVALRPDNAAAALHGAIASVEAGRPAALLLPMDVQNTTADEAAFSSPPARAEPPEAGRPRSEAISVAVRAIETASRPLFLVGRGAHAAGAKQAIEALAEKSGALLATTVKAKDMFRGNRWSLGVAGSFGHSLARRMIAEADCVVSFGAGLNLLTTGFGKMFPSAPLIQIDTVRGHIGRWHPADVAVVGDARLAAEALLERTSTRTEAEKPFHAESIRCAIADFDIRRDYQPQRIDGVVDPRDLMVALDALLPPDRSLVCDGGNYLGAVPYISTTGPGRLKMSSEFSSIGLGFGTALGVAAAQPTVPTVLLIGDGGLLMTLGELETMVRENLPLIVIVMNDGAYNAEVHHLRLRGLPTAKAEFGHADFASIARSFGIRSAIVRSLEDLEAIAIHLTNRREALLVDCRINPSVMAPFMGEVAAEEQR